YPSPLNYRLRSRLHRDGDAIGFYAMKSNRVVPLVRECEVVGVETAKSYGGQAPTPVLSPLWTGEGACPPLEIWEIDGRLITEGEFTIHGYVASTETFFQVNRHMLDTMLRLVAQLAS